MSPQGPSRRPPRRPQDGRLARRVLERAADLGLSQTALAEATGLARQTLIDLLRVGQAPRAHWPNVRTLLALASQLKVHPYWLTEALCADARVSLHLSARMLGDRAGFVEDSTAPDGCVVAPGARFVKTWTCQKLSNTDWTGCRLARWDEQLDVRALLGHESAATPPRSLFCDADSISLDGVREGEVFAADLLFEAPATPGLAFSYWVAVDAQGVPMFTEHAGVAVIVQVVEGDLSCQPALKTWKAGDPPPQTSSRVYRR